MEEKKETKPAKKVEEKKVVGNKKANNNTMIIGIAIVAVVIIAILACVFLMKDSPKKVVENSLKNLKTEANVGQMLSGLLGENNINTEAQALLFEKLEWKILNQTEEDNKATVEVEITNKDFKTIMQNLMQKIFVKALGGSVTEEDMLNYLIEELKSEEIQTVTSNETIELQKQNGKWEIADEEELIYITLPGFSEVVDALK